MICPVPTFTSRLRLARGEVAARHPAHRPGLGYGVGLACGVLVSVWLAGDSGQTQEPAMSSSISQPNLAKVVPVWVDELDAAQQRVRREAERKLIEAGPSAAEYLPVVTNHLSAEARERLNRVETRWQAQRLDQQTRPVIVNLAGRQTLQEALQAIEAASGVRFQYRVSGDQAVTPPAAPMGFWNALDWVLDQTNLDINFYAGERNVLALIPRGQRSVSRVDSATYAGIYRLQPTVVTARRVLASPDLNSLNVTILLSWQPNRTPIGLTVPLSELTGRFSHDLPLKPQNEEGQIDVAASEELAQSEFFLPLELPSKSPESIEQLGGVIRALLPGKQATFRLDLNKPAASETRDAMTVAIERVHSSGPLHEIRLGVALEDAGRALESHRQWIFENQVQVILKDETRLDHLGYEVYRQTAEGIGISYLFDFGGGPIPPAAELHYRSATSVKQTEVPFQIRDIPLP